MRVKDKRAATDTVKGLMLDLQGSFLEVLPRVNRGLQSLRCAQFDGTYVYNYRPNYIAKPL